MLLWATRWTATTITVRVTYRVSWRAARRIDRSSHRWPTVTYAPNSKGPLGLIASRRRRADAFGNPWGSGLRRICAVAPARSACRTGSTAGPHPPPGRGLSAAGTRLASAAGGLRPGLVVLGLHRRTCLCARMCQAARPGRQMSVGDHPTSPLSGTCYTEYAICHFLPYDMINSKEENTIPEKLVKNLGIRIQSNRTHSCTDIPVHSMIFSRRGPNVLAIVAQIRITICCVQKNYTK
jgi:hypothetical protein